ncbi:hypothetical protein JXA32_08770 [Candidatus Sumerlaeota bacterium]|nr:hypothetical protein [Candidatus Sumerlaeota bacterium]
MADAQNVKSGRGGESLIASLVFWVLFFLFILFYIEPTLIHHSYYPRWRLPTFVPGTDFFADWPPFPGKPIVYLSGWMFHLFYLSWAGALIITAVAFLMCLGLDKYLNAISGDRARWLRFAPALVVLVQYNHYNDFLMENLSIALCLLSLYAYTHLPVHRSALRFLLFLAFSCALYYIAVYAWLLFFLLGAIDELLHRRDWKIALAQLAAILPMPLAFGPWIFDQELIDAYRSVLPYDPQIEEPERIVLQSFLYVFILGASLSCASWNLYSKKRKASHTQLNAAQKNIAETTDEKPSSRRLRFVLTTAILLIVVFGAAWLSTDRVLKMRLRVSYFAQHRMWPELLQEASKLSEHYYDISYCHDVNRALYHSGRLLDDMFAYPQPIGWQLYHVGDSSTPLDATEKLTRNISLPETLYEMGRVNEAEHFALDGLTNLKYHPQGLMQLAMINIVKHQPDAARVFLRSLRKDCFYRDEAQAVLDQLDKDPDFSSDKQVQQIRASMPDIDKSGESTLEELLAKNENNRMAFEYMMADNLQKGQLSDIAENIKRFANMKYPALPRTCEEALVIYMHKTNTTPDLHGYAISQESVERFSAINNILFNKYHGDPVAAFEELVENYGDSFFFYYLYTYVVTRDPNESTTG